LLIILINNPYTTLAVELLGPVHTGNNVAFNTFNVQQCCRQQLEYLWVTWWSSHHV